MIPVNFLTTLRTLRTSVHPGKGKGTPQMYKDVKIHSEKMKR